MNINDKAITIYDIAREAEVSPATVSRVLTGKAKVRQDKADRIRKVMDDLDYHPNLMARNLQASESKTLGVILPDISNPFFAEFFLEVESYALTLGYTVYLCNTMNNAYQELGNVESIYLQSLLERRVDGILFMGGRINDKNHSEEQIEEMRITCSKVPLIMINGRMNGVDSYIVKTDERAGFIQMVEYLISKGHRDLALIGGIKGMLPADLKIRAFHDLMKKKGLSTKEEWILPGGFSIESGEEMFDQILGLKEKPSAIVCMNDSVAIGVLRRALKEGIKIPDEMSISGFDNISIAAHLFPSLSTVSHNFPALARKALDAFLDIKAGKKTAKISVMPMELLIRESTGPLS